ncbi:hypothetical protein [Nocardia salmonicida]|uniref:hypothetical protein n=1 Tax=Nocardia salmonicida TaxID=53431 RepID=UPI00378F4D52
MITAATRRHVAEELRAAADAYRAAVDGPDARTEDLAAARWQAATAAATVLLTDSPDDPAQPADGPYAVGAGVLWICALPLTVGAPLFIQPGIVRAEAPRTATSPGRRYVVAFDDDHGMRERTVEAADIIRSPTTTPPATRRAS